MENALIRRSKRGPRSADRFAYNADELAIIMIGLGTYLPIHAPLAVNELSNHEPTSGGPLWQDAADGSFESLLAPLSGDTTLRNWLSGTFVRFAALTPEERKTWVDDDVARQAFLEFTGDPDISTTLGSCVARFEWGPPDNRKNQEFKSNIPVSFEDILEVSAPHYRTKIVIRLYFPLLFTAGGLLARSDSDPVLLGNELVVNSDNKTAASLPGVAAAVAYQDRKSSPRNVNTPKGRREKKTSQASCEMRPGHPPPTRSPSDVE